MSTDYEKDLVERYTTAALDLDEKTTIKTAAEKLFTHLKQEMHDYLARAGKKSTANYSSLGSITVNKPKLRVSINKEFTRELFDWLRNVAKRPDLISTSVAAKDLGKFLQQLKEQGVPYPDNFIKSKYDAPILSWKKDKTNQGSIL